MPPPPIIHQARGSPAPASAGHSHASGHHSVEPGIAVDAGAAVAVGCGAGGRLDMLMAAYDPQAPAGGKQPVGGNCARAASSRSALQLVPEPDGA